MAEHNVIDNTDLHRFETTIDGVTAFLDYALHGERLTLVHTEVPEELEGHGVGGALVQFAIDHAAKHAYTVVPRCPFARGWLERHPDAAARVTIGPPA
jgi:predicted GNAT family acetyltransferase